MGKEHLVDAMRESLSAIPGVRFNFSQPIKDNVEESVSGVRGKVVLKIFGHDLERMRETLEQAKAELKDVPGIIDLDLYRESRVPQLQIRLNRDALSRAGITVDAAQSTIETSLAGRVLTDVWQGERPIPVRVIDVKHAQEDIEHIGNLMVPTPAGARIPLKEIATLQIESGRTSIERESNSRFLALKFNVENRDLGSVVHESMGIVSKRVKVPEGHFLIWGGEFENQQRAMTRLLVVIPIAVFIVFSLLYMALQSAASAIAILLSTPFAMTGGVLILLVSGIPLSVSAAIGFIALLGQVSLMGLLVLSAAEELRLQGTPLHTAIRQGATDRLRPVLMASMLALLGLLPMAVSKGIGSETQQPFAIVIVGGMFTTFLVAMFVLPVLYSWLAPKRLKRADEDELNLIES